MPKEMPKEVGRKQRMPPPSKQAIQVAVDALRTEANMWLHQSDQMQAIAHSEPPRVRWRLSTLRR
jgi:hypothetical protein